MRRVARDRRETHSSVPATCQECALQDTLGGGVLNPMFQTSTTRHREVVSSAKAAQLATKPGSELGSVPSPRYMLWRNQSLGGAHVVGGV